MKMENSCECAGCVNIVITWCAEVPFVSDKFEPKHAQRCVTLFAFDVHVSTFFSTT